MPFIDLNIQDFSEKVAFDITIIGAGAAGILLAVKLSEAGKRVLLIETGQFGYDKEKQSLNKVVNSGKYLSNAIDGRIRAIGGTTLAWGGQSLPFTPMDFSKRTWVENSGWPINFEEVEKYYNEANQFMGVDTFNFKEDIFGKIKVQDPGFDPSKINFHVSKWAPVPDFEKVNHAFLQSNVTVLYNAQLIKISKNGQSSIESISISNFNGKKYSIGVCKLILAAGGIESVRILLNNDLGNKNGLTGKGFMEHPCIKIGSAGTGNQYKLQSIFNTHLWQRRKYSIRMSLSDAFQLKEQCLNCSASLMFLPPGNAFDPYAEIKSFMKDLKLKRLTKVSMRFPSIAKSIYALLKDRFYYKVNAEISLVLMTEQEPVHESSISLSPEKDRFGLNQANIKWTITEKTWHTIVKTAAILKSEIERLGLAKVCLSTKVNDNNPGWMDCLSDVNHHMGGARMSPSPEEGVVDRNLQVWNVPNLYVCSSAVFPTSSHSNPTLTILALGCRLVDFLTEPGNAEVNLL